MKRLLAAVPLAAAVLAASPAHAGDRCLVEGGGTFYEYCVVPTGPLEPILP